MENIADDWGWITIQQIKKICGIPEQTMRFYAKRGFIPAFRVGKRLMFRRVDVDAFFSQNKILSTADVDKISTKRTI